MRLIFLGTPSFAVPSLDALAREHDIALVVAQPDKPAGRGMNLQVPAVVERARELGLNVAQPPKVRDPQFLERVAQLQPDAGIVIAYGKILPASLLSIPKHGFLNVHGSILPKWRGAAPIQRAIEAGDTVTGVTIMRLDEELDHGPMLSIVPTPIGPDERTPALFERLANLGANALAEVLRDFHNVVDTPQDHDEATYAAKIEKGEGAVTFGENAANIYNRYRAFDPWPGIYVESRGETIKLKRIALAEGSGAARSILHIDSAVRVACGDGAIDILEMQRPGKSRAPAGDVARGLGWRAGEPLP